MIPTIEQIIEDLLAGTISKSTAVTWLHMHAEGAENDLRDHFAGLICASMVSTIKTDEDYYRAKACANNMGFSGLSDWFASDSYKQADALIKEKDKA